MPAFHLFYIRPSGDGIRFILSRDGATSAETRSAAYASLAEARASAFRHLADLTSHVAAFTFSETKVPLREGTPIPRELCTLLPGKIVRSNLIAQAAPRSAPERIVPLSFSQL